MRLGLGIALIYLAAASLLGPASAAISIAQQVIAAGAGVLVVLGLWTPVTAILAALDQIWVAFSLPVSQRGDEWIHVLLAVLCASAAMLGPGAWSIDARLFGRRRFPTHRTPPKDHHPKG